MFLLSLAFMTPFSHTLGGYNIGKLLREQFVFSTSSETLLATNLFSFSSPSLATFNYSISFSINSIISLTFLLHILVCRVVAALFVKISKTEHINSLWCEVTTTHHLHLLVLHDLIKHYLSLHLLFVFSKYTEQAAL